MAHAAAQSTRKRQFTRLWYAGLAVSFAVGLICLGLSLGFAATMSDGLQVFLGGFLGGALSSILELIRNARTQAPERPLRVYTINFVVAPFLGGLMSGFLFATGFVQESGQLQLPGFTIKAIGSGGFTGLGTAIGFSAQTILANVIPGIFGRTENA